MLCSWLPMRWRPEELCATSVDEKLTLDERGGDVLCDAVDDPPFAIDSEELDLGTGGGVGMDDDDVVVVVHVLDVLDIVAWES
jgi:hypothetical protein